MKYTNLKLKTEFFCSNRCIDFINEMMTNVPMKLIQDIKKVNSENSCDQKIDNFLNVLESEFESQRKPESNFKYHEISYGTKIYDNMEVPKALYLIDIFDLLQPFFKNPQLKSMIDGDYQSDDPSLLKSFFDGSFYKSQPCDNIKKIYLSIYADEINLINPIGNIYFFKVMHLFKRSI